MKEMVRLNKRKHTKANIFEAATRLFSEKGFSGATLRNIASLPSVGISETAIYRHFESKAAILDEIFSVFRTLSKSYIPSHRQIDAYLKTDTPRQLLVRFIPTCKDEDSLFMTQAYRILFREQFTRQEAREIVNGLIGETADSLQYALERLMEAGAIPMMDAKAFSKLWSMNMFSNMSINDFARPNPLLVDGMIHMMITGNLPV